MAAPKGGSDSGSTTTIVMIIFIVLFLISSVFAIMFYVNLETANRTASDATARLERMGNPAQITTIEELAESSGLTSGNVFDKLDAVVKYLSESIVGVDAVNYNLAAAKSVAYPRVESLWAQIAAIQEKNVEEVKAGGLAYAVESLLALINDRTSTHNTEMEEIIALVKISEAELEKSGSLIAELQKKLDSFGQTVVTMKDTTEASMTDLRSRYDSNVDSIRKEKDMVITTAAEFNKQIESEMQELAKLREKMGEMEKFLRDNRQKPTQEVEALDPDGTIISVDSREQMVFINLAAKDKIYRGLTFSVYDGLDKTIPVTGQGKATIEVIEVMDDISRCRVVDNPSKNPIIKGDIIANLVWDAQRQFVFCLVGDFDFDMDGEIDIDGNSRLETLISGWGGKVQDFVGVDTDFLVFGNKPIEDDQLNAAYTKALDDGVRLGVPSFNTQRFFRFIGYSKKQVIN